MAPNPTGRILVSKNPSRISQTRQRRRKQVMNRKRMGSSETQRYGWTRARIEYLLCSCNIVIIIRFDSQGLCHAQESLEGKLIHDITSKQKDVHVVFQETVPYPKKRPSFLFNG
mmetsp:Transcript_15055/g.26197  ORF Transcript_15055/g.26197 Transcript_15055/m.26197 type:complete len:114 (+) Transcript_15055:862-1203(+)